MKPKLVIVGLFLLLGAVLVWLVSRTRAPSLEQESSASPAASAALAPPPASTVISLLYGTEKQAWIESAVAEFHKQRPDVRVELIGKGSLDSAQAILDGSQKPTLFSPADSLVLNLLESDWNTKYKQSLFATGDLAPSPLVLTPLVFAIWRERAEPLSKGGNGRIDWKRIHSAVASNRGWPAVGGKPEWGFVKLGHTDPTRSNSGLQALLLMTFDYYGKSSGLSVADLLDPKYQRFIGEIEKSVPKSETSTGSFMTDMVRFGPSKYDIAVVYENLAISQIENAQGRWGDLRIFYPTTTLWSDHPVALLNAEWVTPEQREAAKALVAFLKSPALQRRALDYGFRPADPAVPLRTQDSGNPFNRLAKYGLAVDLPPAATAPEGEIVRNLLTMWSRVVGGR